MRNEPSVEPNNSLIQKAAEHMNKRQFQEARDIYIRICDREHENPDALLMLGTLHANLGDFGNAASCFMRVTRLSPNNIQAHYNFALAQQKQGKTGDALESYKKCIDLNPDFVYARYNLASTLLNTGNLGASESVLREAISRQPEFAQFHGCLAGVLYKKGGFSEALDSCRLAIDISPNHAEIYCQLGQILVALKRHDEALEAYNHAISINPLLTDAYICVSQIEGDEHKMQQAATLLENVIRQQPDNLDAYMNLGKFYANMSMFERASRCYEHILAFIPTHPEAHYNLGRVLKSLNRLNESLTEFETASLHRQGYIDAIIGQADILDMQGFCTEAKDLIEPVIRENPGYSAQLYVTYAEILRHLKFNNEAVSVLEGFLENSTPATPDLHLVHYLLGNILDELREFDRAFSHIRNANNLSNKCFNYQKHTRLIDNIMTAFSRESLSSLPHTDIFSGKPVFIVGMPRSGTSLVEQILDSHGAICGGGELRDMAGIFQALTGASGDSGTAYFPDNMHHLDKDFLTGQAEKYLGVLDCISVNAKHVTDKMPQNFLFLGLIALMFPKAHVIHCHRNPLDTCLSIYFQGFEPVHSYSDDLNSIGDYYRKYSRLMDHWRETLDLPILDVCYEDLVHDQESLTRIMLDFLGVEWDENCMNFHKNRRIVNTFSREQVRQPIHAKAVGRWRNYQDNIGVLVNSLGSLAPTGQNTHGKI